MKSSLPNIKTDFPEWYQEVVHQSELADQSPVRGAIVIRPYGYALWEEIRNILNQKIKGTGHQNAAFPLLIPLSFLQKEAEHVEGFAPELAIVTHAGGKELEEPYVIRPTSETIIHFMFAKWIKSWRDLPLKINQWANVIRWEMRTRPFLRTTEFFWQEGHTAHETFDEAQAEAELMWREYIDLYENYLAIPVVPGLKTEQEKFAGADRTYTVEGLMPDGKALQLCTSHLISQNFAKSFNMVFQDQSGQLVHPYLTSWGLTTRSVGALIMMHGDQKGLVLPPKVAPIQIVIVPILKKDTEQERLLKTVHSIASDLASSYRVHVDDRDYITPGAKFYEWELKGVPLRIELGPRDLAQDQAILVDRVEGNKKTVALGKIKDIISQELAAIQSNMFNKAHRYIQEHWYTYTHLDDLVDQLAQEGGFFQTGWCGDAACENKLKDYKATIRCQLPEKKGAGCFYCKKPSKTDVLIAKAY